MSNDFATVGAHEASARLLLAQRAVEGVQVPASLALDLIDAGRWLDNMPADDSPDHVLDGVRIAQLMVSIERQIADLAAHSVGGLNRAASRSSLVSDDA